MNTPAPIFRPGDAVAVLRKYRLRWLLPMLLCGASAAGYAVLKPKLYEASQTLMLRSDAVHQESAPGKFRSVEEMKVTQETVLELAQSSAVLTRALRDVGPRAGGPADPGWPTEEEVRELQEQVRLAAPRGAEFGKTEIFYLLVRDREPARAMALCRAICQRLLECLNRVRDGRARSLIEEFERTVAVADADLAAASQKLRVLEEQVGGRDLAELRMLDTSATGDSDLRRLANALDEEWRQVQTALRANEELLDLLKAAHQDQRKLLAAPNRLLESLPAIRKLRDGLVDAQLRLAQLQGSMTHAHPLVAEARGNVDEVLEQLRHELEAGIRGLEVESRLVADRRQTLETQRNDIAARLNKLAAIRAEYSMIVADVKHRTALAEEARRNLASARAVQAAAEGSNLLQFVDTASVDKRPLGPSRSVIVLGGMAGGLALGLALVFLSLPTHRPPAADHSPQAALGGPLETPLPRETAHRAAALGITSMQVSQESSPGSLAVLDVWMKAGHTDRTVTQPPSQPPRV